MSMKKMLAELDSKLKTLRLRIKQSDAIVEQRDADAMQRHRDLIKVVTRAIEELRISIEEAKFSAGESEETVEAWSQEVAHEIANADESCANLAKCAKEIDAETKSLEEAKRQENVMKFERQLIEQKQKAENESRDKVKKSIKLPELTITKFSGTPLDWVRFEAQFVAMVDSQPVSEIQKFSYLKESVTPRIRSALDCLPFSEEGYKRGLKYLRDKYGHPSEVAGHYIVGLLELQPILERDVGKITKFYEKLLFNVESLRTLGRLDTIEGAAFYIIIKKLEILRGELVTHGSGDWRDWSFSRLLEALRKWTESNATVRSEKRSPRRPDTANSNSFHSHDVNVCVFCQSSNHKTTRCDKVSTPEARKKFLAEKKLCFNCASGQHAASTCKSKVSCQKCKKRHHTSICLVDREQTSEPGMPSVANTVSQPAVDVATSRNNATGLTSNDELGLTSNVDVDVTPSGCRVIHPIVVVKVAGIKFRALLDSGASHTYVSSRFIELTQANEVKKESRRIATLMGTSTSKFSQYDIRLESVDSPFGLDARVTKIEKSELLNLENTRNNQLVQGYSHLRDLKLVDVDTKEILPVHIILGVNEYAQIRTAKQPRVGRRGEPIAEHTRFGWALMSPGMDGSESNGYLAVNSSADYERLCSLDVLGLADSPSGDQKVVHQEFREQLTRDPQGGWYETGLPWKGNHPPLPNNQTASLRRLQSCVKKLRASGKLEEYHNIISEQLELGIVEEAADAAVGREFYMPHRAVIRENVQSTKMRVVYDCSARPDKDSPSLNDCLETGPALQNKLWDVLVRGRFRPVLLAADMKKAFLQVRIRESDRDALRFHWLRSAETNEVMTLRFTRALFGLVSSPFLLGGVVEQHLANWSSQMPDLVNQISKDLYVDDLISGASTVEEARELKQHAITVFDDASFTLHKWNSNVPELETENNPPDPDPEPESTYAKQQFQSSSEGGSKLLGMPWNKDNDTVGVVFPPTANVSTKREVLRRMATVYDPLGFASPILLQAKLIYRDACESKVAWDSPLPDRLAQSWKRWESNIPPKLMIPRSLPTHREPIDEIELHAFGDASGHGVASAVYAVVRQARGTNQGLVATKSRLAKQGLTIPRLELVGAHMAANMVDNVRRALSGFPITLVQCWLDSTVALHWICGGGEYRQFVSNRVRKISEHNIDTWRYVPSVENPADVGSRGGSVVDDDLWWNGPRWLSRPDLWPSNPIIKPSAESAAESKIIREVIANVTVTEVDSFDNLLERFSLKKTLRVCAFVKRFLDKCRRVTVGVGALTTAELETQLEWWIRRVQSRARSTEKFQHDELQLNLVANDKGILECRGRIQGSYPEYLPDACRFTERLVQREHCNTLHGGVSLTMARIRERYWIPRLRQLTKKVLKRCWGCKRFHAKALAVPPPGLLPKERTEGGAPFEIVGVDFAGPIRYRRSARTEGKAYLVLYACSLTRALHLEILPNLETGTFLGSLKRLIARRGRPVKLVSDNGGTFIGAAKWLKQVGKDEQLQGYLAEEQIRWKFNLSRAPWWGGQFERLVGVFKQAFYKCIGGSTLCLAELAEVVLDVEIQLNNRPLSYVEDDVELPLLTPAAFLFQRTNRLPEQEPWKVEDACLRKRARYLRSCKDALWRRWTGEYLRVLRERHHCNRKGKVAPPSVGDVVIVRSDEKNRGKWPLAIVEELFPGRDGVVRAVKLRCGKSFLERPVQHLYPLELQCDVKATTKRGGELNPEAPPFRPKRDAAVAANVRLAELANEEDL